MRHRDAAINALLVAGAGLVAGGLALIWLPLGVIASGLALVGVAVLLALPEERS